MAIKLFDKEINVRDYYCKLSDDSFYVPVNKPYINLYIQMKGCNASCKFCEYMNLANPFNINKFIQILKYFDEHSNEIDLNKISITGGEPTLNISTLYSIMDEIQKFKNNHPYVYLVMNSNGYNLKKLYNDNKIDFFNSISLSRHHYDQTINNKIFNTNFKTISDEDLINIINDNKDVFHFSCNLINEYISTPEDIYKYLDYCNSMNIYDVGFVGLMKINDYCKSNYVDFNLANLTKHKLFKNKLFIVQTRQNYEYCKCLNYLYLPQTNFKKPIKIYSRCVLTKTCPHTNNLVFDGENLRIGFGGKILF